MKKIFIAVGAGYIVTRFFNELAETYDITVYDHFWFGYQITDKVTKIKVNKLSEMLCNVETIKVVKESHILSLLRYYDLITELKKANK